MKLSLAAEYSTRHPCFNISVQSQRSSPWSYCTWCVGVLATLLYVCITFVSITALARKREKQPGLLKILDLNHKNDDSASPLVSFPNPLAPGSGLADKTPLDSPIWLWRLPAPTILVAPPKTNILRISTCMESRFAVESFVISAVGAELQL